MVKLRQVNAEFIQFNQLQTRQIGGVAGMEGRRTYLEESATGVGST